MLQLRLLKPQTPAVVEQSVLQLLSVLHPVLQSVQQPVLQLFSELFVPQSVLHPERARITLLTPADSSKNMDSFLTLFIELPLL